MSMEAKPLENTAAPSSMEVLERDFERVRGRLAVGPEAAGVDAPDKDVWERTLLAPVREILSRPGKAFRQRLFEASYALAGGRGAPLPELAQIVEVIHAGSMIVDDIEDGSTERRGGPAMHVMFGMPTALNAGNWMYFWPLDALERLQLPAETELAMSRRMSRAMFDAHTGQALDVSVRIGRVPRKELPGIVAAATDLKTGALVQLAAELGGLAAGGKPEAVAALGRFGRRLGLGLQMLDDLGNLWGTKNKAKRHEDLRLGRATWPWAWAAGSMDDISFSKLEDASLRAQHRAELLPRHVEVPGLEELAAELLAVVAFGRRAQVHDQLQAALGELESAFGPSPIIAQVAREISRLEGAYV